jgi:hypothetical protein
MGLLESATSHPENQAGGGRKPRVRQCLLKGCERGYRPGSARQRYCSESCQKAARAWLQRKAQTRYRTSAAGKAKRQEQSRRYRERVRQRKAEVEPGVRVAARVIPKKFF